MSFLYAQFKLPHRREHGPRVLIIGAGVAGLAAATRLIRDGFRNIKILEAENRIGGRVYSVPSGNSLFPFTERAS